MYNLHKKRDEPKRVILLLGLPGSGKTTISDLLVQISGGVKVRLPEILAPLYSSEEKLYNTQNAILFSGKEDVFFDHVNNINEHIIISDGFLRSLERLQAISNYSKKVNWRLEILYIHLGNEPEAIKLSRERQLSRDIPLGKSIERIDKKIERDAPNLNRILELAETLKIDTHVVDGRETLPLLIKSVRRCLKLDPYALNWDIEMLQKLYSIAPDAWVIGGGNLYKPFFNNRYGPPSLSWDIDLSVLGKGRAEAVQIKLDTQFPEFKWDVKDIRTWSEKELGYTLHAAEDSISKMALFCTCVGMQWSKNGLMLVFGHERSEADLWNGILVTNKNGHVKFAPDKIKKILEYYPNTYCPELNNPIVANKYSYTDVMNLTLKLEKGGKYINIQLTPEETAICNDITNFRNALDKQAQPIPLPYPGNFPQGDPWLAPDNQFRFWIYNQFRSRNPFNGKNEYIQNAINVQSDATQKPTHQGWSLKLHVLHSLLDLETDHMIDYRKELRIGMLWHDVGKIWNKNTPGAHQFIGAKKWVELQNGNDLGLTESQVYLITEIIKYHDIFGRLERSLWDSKYNGSISLQYVRESLSNNLVTFQDMVRLTKCTWRADVGGTPLLRWLKPLSELLETLIMVRV